MPTLSVVMIVKDEAHCLAECLDSIRDIADEIVIGDTGSTDDTVAVAHRYAAKVHAIPWRDDFAAARNEVLQHATGDWLLHLDADEVLDPAGATRIREIIDNKSPDADAIELILANYSDDLRAWRWVPVPPLKGATGDVPPLKGGRGDVSGNPMARGHAGYVAVGLLRLFRNHRGFEYREAVHENITESVVEKRGIVRVEPILIHHYGFAGDPARAQAKAAFYQRIASNKVQQRPNDPKAWHDLAEQSFACGDAATAEYSARQALSLDPNHLSAASMLANILLNRGDLDEARELFQRLEQTGVTAHHIGTVLGAIAYRQGRIEEARQRLEDVIQHHPKAIQAYLYLARVLEQSGDIPAARTQLEQAHAITPTIQEIADRLQSHDLRQLGERQLKHGNPQEALSTLVQALKLDPEDPLTHNHIGTVLTTLGLHDKAQESFHRAHLLAPAMPK